MKALTLQLPIAPTRELALAIVDQLPSAEYSRFMTDIGVRSRDRALASLRRFRAKVKASGLTQQDFTQALEEVRADRSTKNARCRH